MKKCILTVDPMIDVKITEIINHNIGRRVGYRFEALNGEENAIEVSDGHHTMEELYEHCIRLYLALVKAYDELITPLNCNVRCWKAKKHDDGSEYEGRFLLGMTVTKPQFNSDQPPEKYDISYYIPMKYWHLARVVELEKAPPYDGYTSDDVLERLFRL